jgi:hypothetical protein
MESKLESVRIRAEEASSGATGDSQVKLLRQVETLQTQYSIASENWQGIESTLLARITNLEKERDEASKRESDMRKKAREAVGFHPPYLHTCRQITYSALIKALRSAHILTTCPITIGLSREAKRRGA